MIKSFPLLKEISFGGSSAELMSNFLDSTAFREFKNLNLLTLEYGKDTSLIFETLYCKTKPTSNSLVQIMLQYNYSFIKKYLLNERFPFLHVVNGKVLTKLKADKKR